MDKLIIKDGYTIEEAEYIWKFVQGIIENKYCEIGIICNGKEVISREYSRQLCLFDLTETKKKFIATNNSVISFPESKISWGFHEYYTVNCNGSTLWFPSEYNKYPTMCARNVLRERAGSVGSRRY
jgi:hypothetical protein